jgi:hypothetical protein
MARPQCDTPLYFFCFQGLMGFCSCVFLTFCSIYAFPNVPYVVLTIFIMCPLLTLLLPSPDFIPHCLPKVLLPFAYRSKQNQEVPCKANCNVFLISETYFLWWWPMNKAHHKREREREILKFRFTYNWLGITISCYKMNTLMSKYGLVVLGKVPFR